MFGKSQWFRSSTIGFGLKPITWRGWAYSLVWGAVIGLPFMALLARHQGPEALIWLTASLGLLAWDVRGLRRDLSGDKQPVLFIGEDGCSEQLAANHHSSPAGK